MKNKLMTLSELSQRTGLKADSLKHAAQQGRLRASKSGKVWLSDMESVKEMVKNSRKCLMLKSQWRKA
jgi:hypothetical protein